MAIAEMDVAVEEIEVFADDLDVSRAAAIYHEHGCLVVRGLMKPYIDALARDIGQACDTSISLLDRAEKIVEGWRTPDGTLFLPAPEGYHRDKQIMVLAFNYQTSGAFFRSALDEKALDIVEAIVGPDVELFGNGQCLVKEPVGGHPKHLHQDAAYFEHRYEGPVATLSYVVDTDLENGALHVVPGSHQLGQLSHVDTFSHLGLDSDEWPWERAVPVIGSAGDSIFFNYRTIHGSKQNHSRKRRPAFIHRYRRIDDFVTVGATTTANRAENKRRATEAKSHNQRGLVVRGFRKFE
ncbi:MAG: phytanoyl-CoA dioxygenase family protein [Candidatus Poribacteria bacterium]|nr:phytanoyl-CoA dioxygenase family protein [Candidatus Poribacteria bacterium]